MTDSEIDNLLRKHRRCQMLSAAALVAFGFAAATLMSPSVRAAILQYLGA